MKYNRFEELPVWQAAVEFALQVFTFTEKVGSAFGGLGDTKTNLNVPRFQFQTILPRVLSAAQPPN